MRFAKLSFAALSAVVALAAVTTSFAAPLGAPAAEPALARPTGKPHGNPHGTPAPNSHATDQAIREADRATQRAARATAQAARKNRLHFRGVVEAVDASSLLLQSEQGPVTFAITADTAIRIPTKRNASPADIYPGVTAFITAQDDGTGNFTALSINVIPGKPEHIHRVGIVTAYIPGASLTIQGKQGEETTFALSPDLKILPAERAADLEVGSFVTVIARRDPSGGLLTAQGIVIHPEPGTPEATEETATPTDTPTPTATATATETPSGP